MDLDKSSSKNIQYITVTPKERLYMGKSGQYLYFGQKRGESGQSKKITNKSGK